MLFMKKAGYPFLSFAAPFLILIAMLGLFHRQGFEKVQVIPAVCVSLGLISQSFLRRQRRRGMLLREIKSKKNFKS